MGGFAALLVGLGIIIVIYGLMQRAKVGRVSAPLFPTGQLAQGGAAAAGPKGSASAQGNVVCQQPLISPVSGKPCLYYSLKVTNTWKDGDKTKEKVLREEKMAAQFAVDDGSGPLFVDAKEGGDFDPEEKFLEKKKTGLLGGIVGQQLQFGHFSLDTGFGALGSEFTVEERVLPMQQRLYVNGKMSDQGANVLTKPGFPRSLIMSNRSRDEVLGAAQTGAKYALMGGAGSAAVGMILGVVSSFVGGGEAKAETTTETVQTAAPVAELPAAAPADSAVVEPAAVAPVAKAPAPRSPTGATKPATTGTGTTKAPAPSAPAAAPPPKETAAAPKDTGKTPPPPPKGDKKKKGDKK
jgi:hypothetical protein